jgi:hypothetical protein
MKKWRRARSDGASGFYTAQILLEWLYYHSSKCYFYNFFSHLFTMGNHASPEIQPVQRQDQTDEAPQGKSLQPPAFGLNAGTAQLQESEVNKLPNPTGSFIVTDSKALVRTDPPELKATEPQQVIEQGTKVRVYEMVEKGGKKYGKLIQDMGEGVYGPPILYGWTSFANLSTPEAAATGEVSAEGLTTYELTTKQAQTKDGDYNGSDLNNLMLEKAGYNPASKWWSEFTSINLFGQSAPNLHKDFANLLKNAEAKTVAKITESNDYKAWVTATNAKNPNSAATVGKFMGLKNGYSTLRGNDKESSGASMHGFGLAIDFNYTENPWISDDSGKKEDGKGKRTTKTGKMQDCFDRAGALIGETLDYQHVNADSFKYDMAATYDNFNKIDKGIEKYFGLGAADKDANLKALLEKATGEPWKGKSTEEARNIINADLKQMSALWSRTGKEEMIRTNGIMDLDRRLVMSMGEVGLDWGGKYGDMMHFDMRNTGVGKKVQAAKYNKDVKAKKDELKKKEEEAKAAAKAAKAAEKKK